MTRVEMKSEWLKYATDDEVLEQLEWIIETGEYEDYEDGVDVRTEDAKLVIAELKKRLARV